MFREKCTLPVGPTHVNGVALRCVWDVEADATYDVPVERARRMSRSLRPEGGTGLIAVRTLSGKGRIYLDGDEVFEVRGNSLILVEWDRIRRYHCAGPEWHFWWMEFFAYGPLHVPLYESIQLPKDADDEAVFQEMLKDLLSPQHIKRSMASSRLMLLLHEWFENYEEHTAGPHEDKIARVIRKMYDSLAELWPVADMARSVGMSEAGFRREFHGVTGSSPKKFYDRLRMAWAEELLHTTPLSVGEIADRLGFSSPYHFSRAFKKHFGMPPSTVRGA